MAEGQRGQNGTEVSRDGPREENEAGTVSAENDRAMRLIGCCTAGRARSPARSLRLRAAPGSRGALRPSGSAGCIALATTLTAQIYRRSVTVMGCSGMPGRGEAPRTDRYSPAHEVPTGDGPLRRRAEGGVRACGQPGQTHRHVAEVDLRLVTGQAGLRHHRASRRRFRGRTAFCLLTAPAGMVRRGSQPVRGGRGATQMSDAGGPPRHRTRAGPRNRQRIASGSTAAAEGNGCAYGRGPATGRSCTRRRNPRTARPV